MLRDTLIKLYERDLAKLRSEIESYTNENDLWKTEGEITNSAGNLAQHLTGNLKHFIGATLGDSGYVRDRDAEFASKETTKEQLLADVDQTREIIKETISSLTDEDFAKTYPIEVFGEPMTTGYFLVHLTTHFNYHLGQINYHRRMLGSESHG
jgi:uncharacterized damage-inducible protein DinB